MQSIRITILTRSKDQIMLSHFLDNVKYSFTRNVTKLSNDESFGVYILTIKFVEGLKDLYGEIMTTS